MPAAAPEAPDATPFASRTRTRSPSLARVSAIAMPITPPPTTITSSRAVAVAIAEIEAEVLRSVVFVTLAGSWRVDISARTRLREHDDIRQQLVIPAGA